MHRKPVIVFQQNPQDSEPGREAKRPISILAPSIAEEPSSDQESEDQPSDLVSAAPVTPDEEFDEVEQLFLRVQAECNMSRIRIRPMLDEIEEEQEKLLPPSPDLEKADVFVKNEERKEVSSSCVITYRSMCPMKVSKSKPKRKTKAAKQRKKVLQHPEKVQELFNLCIQFKKTQEEIQEWNKRGHIPRVQAIIEKKMRALEKVISDAETFIRIRGN